MKIGKILFWAFIICAMLGNCSGTEDCDAYGNDRDDAWYEAMVQVKSHLKSPSTAKFCSITSATITRDGNTWTVKGYVDAQNSYGATLRSDFRIKITFISSSKYVVDSFYIE